MPGRKQIRLNRTAYADPGTAFLVTICTAHKRAVFSNARLALPVFRSLREEPMASMITCFAVCLMPDHLHVLSAPSSTDLINALNRWKAWSANRVRQLGWHGPVWQRSFHDHALRPGEGLTEAGLYIVSNPVRKGIVDDWRDYPYAWCEGAADAP